MSLETGGLPATSVSQRLTSYPADLISQPLDVRSAALVATSVTVPAATPVPAAPAEVAAPAPASVAGAGAVPGGIGGGDVPSIFREGDLTPFVLLLSLATAFALGAGHALTPGHGKTLMAAYLVGTRGTPIHAVGLGLSVTVSHTLGILVIAALVVGAQGLLAAGRRRPCGAGDRRGDDRRAGRLDARRRGAEAARGAARRPRPMRSAHDHAAAHARARHGTSTSTTTGPRSTRTAASPTATSRPTARR